MKKPVLPLRIRDHALAYGQNYAEFECGLSDQDSAEYQKEFVNGVNEFCSQWLEEQTGRKWPNPSIPPGFTIHLAFADDLYEGTNSFLGKKVKDDGDRKKFSRQMMRAVTSLNSIFTSLGSGLVKFNRETGKSDFAFDERTGSREENAPQILEKTKNRYRRAFTLSILLGMLKYFYSIEGERVSKLIDSLLTEANWKKLQTKKANLEFGDAIKRGMVKAFGNFDAVSEIEKELRASGFMTTIKK
jgi:hypothetical protein